MIISLFCVLHCELKSPTCILFEHFQPVGITSTHLQAIRNNHTFSLLLSQSTFQSLVVTFQSVRPLKSGCSADRSEYYRSKTISLSSQMCCFSSFFFFFFTFFCRVQRKIWAGGTTMKCEHLRQRALHSCAASKVSASYFCAILEHKGATICRVAVHAKFQVTTTGNR